MYRVILACAMPAAPPAIVAQPQSQTAGYGNNATLTVQTTGSGPFTYQWRFNGSNIPGATGSSLALTGLNFTNAGVYNVVISGAGGTITSSPSIFNVAPKLLAQLSAKNLSLSWPSPFILQSASSPTGPYSDVSGAVSPFAQSTTAAPQKFFRLRSPDFTVTPSYALGVATMKVTGAPGLNFILQASTNMVNWVNLATNTAPYTYIDTAASQYSCRMYRVVLP